MSKRGREGNIWVPASCVPKVARTGYLEMVVSDEREDARI